MTEVVSPGFLFVTCQQGAESAVKQELAHQMPEARLAYSRGGFLTFKLPTEAQLPDDFQLGAAFARASGFCLGKITGESLDQQAAALWQLVGERQFDQLHVWPRDMMPAGERGYTPSLTDESRAAEAAIYHAAPPTAWRQHRTRPPARTGELILDCVLVGPQEWWVGFHRAATRSSQLPGGMLEATLPAEAVSRAYLKMEESLHWAALPLAPGDVALELGCAPGGASQALLARGLQVIGVDPAAMPEALLANPNFRHIRRRVVDVPRREIQTTRWLAADMNVAPEYTLEAVESIVMHPRLNVRGLILTLKLLDWQQAAELPSYLQRLRSWGFESVRARQLQYNRQEVCVAAIKGRFGKPRWKR